MSFRPITANFSVSPQLTIDQVEEAARLGFGLIINNRPDGEAEDQINGAEIEAAATQLGLAYLAFPVTTVGAITDEQIATMVKVLNETEGKILAYCRSGTRSANLWALAQASEAAPPPSLRDGPPPQTGEELAPPHAKIAQAKIETIFSQAQVAGYDLSSLLPRLYQLALD